LPNEYADYTANIVLGNPALVFLGEELYGEYHVVLGIGFYNAYMSPAGIIVYDDLTHGEHWLSLDFVHGFIFMYDGSSTSSSNFSL